MYRSFVLKGLLLILIPHTIVCKYSKNILFTSDTRKEICVNKHPGYSFLLANDMRCMEDKIKSVSPESLSLLTECWKEITGVEPKEDSDYSEVYCRDESPYILVNMVHDCFLRNFVKDRVEARTRNQNETVNRIKIVEGLYRHVEEAIGARGCPRTRPVYRNLRKSEILEFVECIEVKPYEDSIDYIQNYLGTMGRAAIEYFQSIYQLNERTFGNEQDNNNRSYCQDDLQFATEQIQCLKEKMRQNMTILRKCFKDITWTSSQFPESDAQIKGYLCDNQLSYPMALMKKVEECAIRRTLGPETDFDSYFEDHESKRCISLSMLDDKHDFEYSWFVADDIEITYHNNMCRGNNVSLVREWSFQNSSTHQSVCVSDKFNKESRGKSSVGKVIDYCWNYLMSHGQFVNSTVKEIPNSDEDWVKFFCSHDYNNKRMALSSSEPFNSCMERMLQLESRSLSREPLRQLDWRRRLWTPLKRTSNPPRSRDHITLMDCLY